jgi:hypothetical protein
MIPRLLTLIVPPFIGLGAGYAFAPMADGLLPDPQTSQVMVQAAEVPNVSTWSEFAVEAESDPLPETASVTLTDEEVIARLGVFQKPVLREGEEIASRLMNLGRFTTRTERDGVRRSITVDLALEFSSYEEALRTYDTVELMRLRDASLAALVTAVNDEEVHLSEFSETRVSGAMTEVIRNGMPAVERVHLIGMSVRSGPARTAMLR